MATLALIIRTGAELGAFGLILTLAIVGTGAVGALIGGLFGGLLCSDMFAPKSLSHLTDWLMREEK